MGKQRKQRQQPSKKKVQVKQKITKQDSGIAAPAKKTIDAKVPEDAKHIQVYGLNNLGNTCFYNSALQALVSVPKLRDFCLAPSDSNQLRKGPIGSALQELVQTVYGHKQMTEAQSAKVSKLSQRDGNPVFSPSRLLAAICKVAPQFKGGQQQDSHELLGKLIEGVLAEEVKAAKALQEQEGDGQAVAPMTEALFGGVLSSQVICDDCGHKTVTLEPFYNLSLPIPSKLRGDASGQAQTKRRLKRITKKEKGDGKASVELPNDSISAQEQAKLASKQNKKKEKEEKRSKLGPKRQQKQADTAKVGTEGDFAAEGYGEPYPSLADSKEAPGNPTKAEAADTSESPPTDSAGAFSAQPKGQLLGGCIDDDSDASSATSLDATIGGGEEEEAPLATACQMGLHRAQHAELGFRSSPHRPPITGDDRQHSGIASGGGQFNEQSSLDGSTAPSLPGQNLQSATCISRDADTLTINAGENTEMPKSGRLAAAVRAHQALLASGQPSPHSQRMQCSPQQRTPGQLVDPSQQVHAASLVPDAKSAAAPLGAAHSYSSSEDEEETSPPASQTSSGRRQSQESSRSVDCSLAPQDRPDLPREGSGETVPALSWQMRREQRMRLRGGGQDTWQGDSAQTNGSHDSHADDEAQHHSSSQASKPELSKAGSAPNAGSKPLVKPLKSERTDGLDPDSQEDSGSAAEASGCKADFNRQFMSRDGQALGSGPGEAPELQSNVSLGSVSATSSVTDADVALYEGLDSLRDEPSAMGDLSSESEEDAAVAGERLKLGHFPTEVPSKDAEEEVTSALGKGSTHETAQDAQDAHEDSPSSPPAENEAAAAEMEEPQKEITLEGCLAAFFAKEEVTWACPAEAKAASSAKSGSGQGQELCSCSPSLDMSTPEGREKLKRRSVSFSEEAPQVKFIPGSAEQRGTNFVLALSGERPFCRPLKHGGGYFLLTAEVDGQNKDSIFLGLQGQGESDETRDTLESCNAIGGAIEFTSVKMDAIQDPADESEQAKVMSQAQALLDCVADLIVHCGVLQTVGILQKGVQLEKSASWNAAHHSAEGWRICGTAPSKDGPATWEYPPATSEAGSSPRPKGDKVYVPREPLGKHPPSSLDAESPLSTLKSRLGAYQQPIPELREGSMGSNSTASLGSTTAETDSQIREGLPNGFPSQSQQQRGSGDQRLDAASTASTAAGTKPASALSAALSEGSDASSSQYAQASLSADAPATPPSEIRYEDSDDLRDAAGAKHADREDSAPRSIPGSRRQVGRTRQLRVQHSAGLSGSPSGTNSSTGTAMFWTGSQAHGISFADDNEIHCKEPQAALVSDADKELAHSPLDTKAQAYGLAFEPHASEDHEEFSHDDSQVHVPTHSTFDGTVSAKEALVERTDEDIRQHGISNIAAAAVAEVDAEQAQQEGEAQGRSHPAASLSGELPPGELLSEPGSVDEEREALGVSPDYKHLKSVPELAKASPEAAHPDAPLSVSPITLSPLPGPRSQELPMKSPYADATPLPSQQSFGRPGTGRRNGAARLVEDARMIMACKSNADIINNTRICRINSMERNTRGILRNKIAGPVKRKAVKGYLVHRAPEVLTLHLKRFQQELSGRLRKIDGPVSFPKELDLSPFCDPEGEDAKGAHYSLVGVVEHQGSMAGGHYISHSARLPGGQPAPPSTSGQSPEPTAPANGYTTTAPERTAASSEAAVQKESVSNGKAVARSMGDSDPDQNGSASVSKAIGKSATDGGDQEGAAQEGAKRAALQLRESLAGSRVRLDAEEMLWFKASDAHVKVVNWDQVAACEPYLLIYVRSQ